MIKWKWWKKHTGEAPKEYEVANGDVITSTKDDVSTKFTWQNLEISEPVSSFLHCFRMTPRRFSLVEIELGNISYFSRKQHRFTDKVSGESWIIDTRPGCYYETQQRIQNTKWLTDEENLSIMIVVGEYYSERKIKMDEIKKARANRLVKKERDRLTKIYKENEQ